MCRFARLRIGEPEQVVEMVSMSCIYQGDQADGVQDLDMLTSDFFIFTTTSRTGSHFYDYSSQTYGERRGFIWRGWLLTSVTELSLDRPFPNCRLPTDVVHLPTINVSVPISFAHCRPSKSSVNTLQASGSMLGLSPARSLSQIGTSGFLSQLLDKKVVDRSVWSIMMINDQEGVFSIGGTGAEVVEDIKQRTTEELDRMGEYERKVKEVADDGGSLVKRGGTSKSKKADDDDWTTKWKWSRVQGAAGWWQILMQGVWVDGSKVIKNQPVIIDVRIPLHSPHPTANDF